MTGWKQVVLGMATCCGLCAHGQQSLAEANRLQAAGMTHAVAESAQPAASLDDALHILFAQADVVFAGTVTSIERTDGAVTVRFRVEDAVRGVTAGSTYVLREWSGLWVDDALRYVEGERRLMLLHSASAAGYASPVWGVRGAIRLRGDAAQPVDDLRWIAAEVSGASATARVLTTSPARTATDNSAVDGGVITDMLHAWQCAEVTQ